MGRRSRRGTELFGDTMRASCGLGRCARERMSGSLAPLTCSKLRALRRSASRRCVTAARSCKPCERSGEASDGEEIEVPVAIFRVAVSRRSSGRATTQRWAGEGGEEG